MTDLNKIITTLTNIDCELSSMIADRQTEIESDPEFTSHDTYDNGEPFCLPEDAWPELDEARSHIQEAIGSLLWSIDNSRL